ncbi:MAG: hypothetical protein JO125_17285 [Chloroflexi bacterium]|nr:hypothetical protein [Ktedonobacteraceae bacterium]MBV8823118.1 hypothetical protein [Ktedonobacteraceae bacterium]MBV9021664.1 hypothetical protein [Ktedonobacteraceae bacterium]MBV9709150.1 hypothetical protein [Chloroflexota bacterium]
MIQAIDWEHASWQEGCVAVEQFTDRLGATIDEGIFETVVVFNLLGFHTFQSCEGHLGHGGPYPWVDVVDTERFNRHTTMWVHVCELEEQAKEARTAETYDQYLWADTYLRTLSARWEAEDSLFKRLIDLLDAFYASQPEQKNPARLLVKRREPGMYRIAPGFSTSAKEIPDFLKAGYLARGQAQMKSFTRYLKRQWQLRQEGLVGVRKET